MLRELIRAFGFRSAARQYARRLGPRLQRDYGTGDYYSKNQIEASARRAGLPLGNIRFGYAAFMSEATFLAQDELDARFGYQELRSILRRYTTHHPSGAFEPATVSDYVDGSGAD